MCGIAGILSTHGGSLSEDVQMMAAKLARRGPDDSGKWVDLQAGVAMGHRRLSILDVSAAGHQPMISASGRYVITYNGEMYNFRKILEELTQLVGHELRLRGHSDTEVLLAAFEHWGIRASIERFNGMFALAVWDRAEQTLWLARDPFGEKPLYYGWFGSTFLFGSELKALKAHPRFDDSIDRQAIASFLRFNCVPAPQSIYQHVSKLPPASLMPIRLRELGRAEPSNYWSMHEVVGHGLRDPFRGTLDDAIEELDHLMRDAVKLRTISDVPLGVFLSGGIDSSLIAAMMRAQHGGRVKTFSIAVSDPQLNEGGYAEAVAQHLQTEHSELVATPEQSLALLPQLTGIYDEPFSDSSQIPTLMLSEFAVRSVTVALSGDGGDELFGGYNRHTWLSSVWNGIGWIPPALRRAIARGIESLSPESWDRGYAAVSTLIPRGRQFAMPGYQLHKFASLLPQATPQQAYDRLCSHWLDADRIVIGSTMSQPAGQANSFASSLPRIEQQMMLFDTLQYLPNDVLVKVDRASMSQSLEVRAAFLDKRVAAFAWRLPLEWKIRKGVGKWILRQVLYRYVPRSLVDRPKRGFGVPLDRWLRCELRDWAEALLDPSRMLQEGYLHPDTIQKRWQQHLSGHRNWAFELWDVLMFQAWLDHSRTPARSMREVEC